MVRYDYLSGFRAIKHQIIPSMLKTKISNLEKYTFDLLNRTCPDWIRDSK